MTTCGALPLVGDLYKTGLGQSPLSMIALLAVNRVTVGNPTTSNTYISNKFGLHTSNFRVQSFQSYFVATYHDLSAIWSGVFKLLGQFKGRLGRGKWCLWSDGPLISIIVDDDVWLGNCSQLPHHETHLCISSFTQKHTLALEIDWVDQPAPKSRVDVSRTFTGSTQVELIDQVDWANKTIILTKLTF